MTAETLREVRRGEIELDVIEDLEDREAPGELSEESPGEDALYDLPYREAPDGIFFEKPTARGTYPIQLTNFTARIIADVIQDDGAERERFFEVEAVLYGRARRFIVPAGRFYDLQWVAAEIGPSAVVYPSKKEHARAAIQLLSTYRLAAGIPERTVYTHLGWREIDGRWFYLHGDGAIGAPGEPTTEEATAAGNTTEPEASTEASGVANVSGSGARLEVAPLPALSRYRLPEPPDGETARRATYASLRFLGVAPPGQSWPLYAAVWTSVLGELLHCNFVVWVHGGTGQRKTTVAALALCHFGEFHHDCLPGNFISTANATETLAFLAKDALLPIDDYAPSSDPQTAHARDALAQRMLRGVGDSHGRHRGTSTGGVRSAKSPRALLLVTGEDLPAGSESLQARVFPVEWKPGSVNLERLTEAQEQEASFYPLAMAGFLSWLAPRMDALRKELPRRVRQLATWINERQELHARIADNAARLLCGAELFLQYGVAAEALGEKDAHQLLSDAAEAISEGAARAALEQEDQRPAESFLRIVRALLSQRQVYLLDRHSGEAPINAGLWGWEIAEYAGTKSVTRRSGAELIGWYDAESEIVCLSTELAYRAVVRFSSSQGRAFATTKRALGTALRDAGLLVRVDEGRSDYYLRVGARREHVWTFPSALLTD